MDVDLLELYTRCVKEIYANPGSIRIPKSIILESPHRPLKGQKGRLSLGLHVGDDDRWRLDSDVEKFVIPIITRQAYIEGFPEPARKNVAIIHACTWLTWREIEEKRYREDFFLKWLEASGKGITSRFATPIVLRNLDRGINLPSSTLHHMLRKHISTGDEHAWMRFDTTALQEWGFHVVTVGAVIPDPVQMSILAVVIKQYELTGRVPRKKEIFDGFQGHALFTKARYTRPAFLRQFAHMRPFLVYHYILDYAMLGTVVLTLFFVPGALWQTNRWAKLLSIPGIYLRTSVIQGGMLGSSMGALMGASFIVPRGFLHAFLEFLKGFREHGLFKSYDLIVHDSYDLRVNLNCYVPDRHPFFILSPMRDDDHLKMRTSIDLKVKPRESKEFLDYCSRKELPKLNRFLDFLGLPLNVRDARYGSLIKVLSERAGVHINTGREWYETVLEKYHLIYPNLRCHLYFNPQVKALKRMFFIIPSHLDTKERERLAAIFPVTSMAKAHTIVSGENVEFIQVYVPLGSVPYAIAQITATHYRARYGLEIGHTTMDYSWRALSYFSSTGAHWDASDALDASKDSLGMLADDSITIDDFVRQYYPALQKLAKVGK